MNECVPLFNGSLGTLVIPHRVVYTSGLMCRAAWRVRFVNTYLNMTKLKLKMFKIQFYMIHFLSQIYLSFATHIH